MRKTPIKHGWALAGNDPSVFDSGRTDQVEFVNAVFDRLARAHPFVLEALKVYTVNQVKLIIYETIHELETFYNSDEINAEEKIRAIILKKSGEHLKKLK